MFEDEITDGLGGTQCPRCKDDTYEYLETYGHCLSCGYSDEFNDDSSSENFFRSDAFRNVVKEVDSAMHRLDRFL